MTTTTTVDTPDRHNMHVLALLKDGQQYILFFDNAGHRAALQKLGDWAADADLTFNWHDAAVLSQRCRNILGPL